MSQSDESRDNFNPLTMEKKLAGPLLPTCGSGPSREILEGRNIHHRGQLGLDLLPPLMEDARVVLGAVVAPEDAVLEQPWAFNGLQDLPQRDLAGGAAERVAASGATERADHAVLSQFLENLGEETLGEPLGLGDHPKLHHRSWRLLGQMDQTLYAVLALTAQFHR